MFQHLAKAEEQLRFAGQQPPGDTAETLSHIIPLLAEVRSRAAELPAGEREAALSRLNSFRNQLAILSAALGRGERILQRYSQYAGLTNDLYRPGGNSTIPRDPSLLNVSV